MVSGSITHPYRFYARTAIIGTPRQRWVYDQRTGIITGSKANCIMLQLKKEATALPSADWKPTGAASVMLPIGVGAGSLPDLSMLRCVAPPYCNFISRTLPPGRTTKSYSTVLLFTYNTQSMSGYTFLYVIF